MISEPMQVSPQNLPPPPTLLVITISANCEAQGILKAEIATDKNGVRRFKFNSFNLALKIGDYSVHLDNLFNGDPVLSMWFVVPLRNDFFIAFVS